MLPVALSLFCFMSGEPCSLDECLVDFAAKTTSQVVGNRVVAECRIAFDEGRTDEDRARAMCAVLGLRDVSHPTAGSIVLSDCAKKHPPAK